AQLLASIKLEVTRLVMNVQIQAMPLAQNNMQRLAHEPHVENLKFQHTAFPDDALISNHSPAEVAASAFETVDEGNSARHAAISPTVQMRQGLPKVGRNEPCPCGSGKKYKQCHGKLV